MTGEKRMKKNELLDLKTKLAYLSGDNKAFVKIGKKIANHALAKVNSNLRNISNGHLLYV